MSDTNATVPTQETPATEQGRTFTQDELNAIVGKRIAENNAKYSDYDEIKARLVEAEAGKDELQKQMRALMICRSN